MMLIEKIRPLVLAAIARGAVRHVGADDGEELVADGLAMAAAMLDSAERNGNPIIASSTAFYVIQALKSGRRSTSASRTDVLSPATSLDGNVVVTSIDAAMPSPDEGDGEMTLHDALADGREGPDQAAGRQIDWDTVSARLDDRQSKILSDAALGTSPSETAEALEVSRPRLTQLRRQVARRVSEAWQTDPFSVATSVPSWRRHVAVAQECRACRAERVARDTVVEAVRSGRRFEKVGAGPSQAGDFARS